MSESKYKTMKYEDCIKRQSDRANEIGRRKPYHMVYIEKMKKKEQEKECEE